MSPLRQSSSLELGSPTTDSSPHEQPNHKGLTFWLLGFQETLTNSSNKQAMVASDNGTRMLAAPMVASALHR
ncbi:hypothetical protein V6N13_124976 [Hibiscus sabdariffa]